MVRQRRMADTGEEAPVEVPREQRPEDPMAQGAIRLLSDAMVQVFLANFRDMNLATAVYGETPEKREEGRHAYLAIQAMVETMTRYANGQIADEERLLMHQRLGLMRGQQAN